MNVCAAGNDRDDARDTQFRALLYRPLEAVELENREGQRHGTNRLCRYRLSKFELDAIVIDAHDGSATDLVSERDIELLADARAQHAREVHSVRSSERCTVRFNLVGNDAAAGHSRYKVQGTRH